MKLPDKGLDSNVIFETLSAYRKHDLATRGGRTWAYVYDSDRAEIEEIGRKAYTMFLSENGLDPTAFPSLLKMENDLIEMAAHHLNGDNRVCGTFTSGGTESCMLAVKTARDMALANNPEMGRPEIILPVTAHAAFHKAAHYFGLKKVMTPVDPTTYKAEPRAIRDAITNNTVLIVASAVSYAHGVIDPIEEIGRIAEENGILFHVDGCVGAFLLPFFEELGRQVSVFDFRVPGVTSISMDFHKYGYTPKGASMIIYRNRAIRRFQYYACAEWTGYTVINTAIQSSKSGGPLASAWAVVNAIGRDGYLDIARRSLKATDKLISFITNHPDIDLMGQPDMCLVSFTSGSVNIFHLIDEMKQKGWYLQPQLAYDCSKENVHISIDSAGLNQVDEMLSDLSDCINVCNKMEADHGLLSLQSMVAQLDPSSLDEKAFSQMLAIAGLGSVDGEAVLPDRLAGINGALNLLPPELTEQCLIEFFNGIFR